VTKYSKVRGNCGAKCHCSKCKSGHAEGCSCPGCQEAASVLEETPLMALVDDFDDLDPVEYFDELDDLHQELDPEDEDDSVFEDYVEERQHLYTDLSDRERNASADDEGWIDVSKLPSHPMNTSRTTATSQDWGVEQGQERKLNQALDKMMDSVQEAWRSPSLSDSAKGSAPQKAYNKFLLPLLKKMLPDPEPTTQPHGNIVKTKLYYLEDEMQEHFPNIPSDARVSYYGSTADT